MREGAECMIEAFSWAMIIGKITHAATKRRICEEYYVYRP